MIENIRVLLVDDHTVVREGIRALMEKQDGLVVVGEASGGAEALKKASELRPDVVVMNLEMPGMNGIISTRRIVRDIKGPKVVILSKHDEESYVFQALKAGASGYILKSSSFDELVEAVRGAHSGNPRFSPAVSRIIMDSYLNDTEEKKRARSKSGKLTGREREILRLIAEGNTNNRIAEQMEISVKTVETHRTNLMKKLDIHDVAGLTRYAIQTGLVVLGRGL